MKPAKKPLRVCLDCGHLAKDHRLAGRREGGAPQWYCWARVGHEAPESCDCETSPADCVPPEEAERLTLEWVRSMEAAEGLKVKEGGDSCAT